jgi:hypothetical protein
MKDTGTGRIPICILGSYDNKTESKSFFVNETLAVSTTLLIKLHKLDFRTSLVSDLPLFHTKRKLENRDALFNCGNNSCYYRV